MLRQVISGSTTISDYGASEPPHALAYLSGKWRHGKDTGRHLEVWNLL